MEVAEWYICPLASVQVTVAVYQETARSQNSPNVSYSFVSVCAVASVLIEKQNQFHFFPPLPPPLPVVVPPRLPPLTNRTVM